MIWSYENQKTKMLCKLGCNIAKITPRIGSSTSNLALSTNNHVRIPVKTITDKDQIAIHPVGRYILTWSITDRVGRTNPLTMKLQESAKTSIVYNIDTESLIVDMRPRSGVKNFLSAYKHMGLCANLTLIPPSVISILLKRDSNQVSVEKVPFDL